MQTEILILGGSGFVGSALAPKLLSHNHNVTLLNRGNRVVNHVTQIKMDRYDADAMRAIGTRFDVVIDTSSYNAEASEIAYQAFGGASCLWLHLSSAAIYHSVGEMGACESDEAGGADIWGEYGRDKYEAELAIMDLATGPYIILRPPYLYGPYNDNDRETFIWSRVLSGRPIILPGSGEAHIQFLHVADLAALFQHFIDSAPGTSTIYNAAAPEIVTSLDWVTRLAKIAGREPKLFFGKDIAPSYRPRDYFPFRDTHCAVATDKLFFQTDWRPHYDLMQGFSDTFKSYSESAFIEASPSTRAEQAILSRRTSAQNPP